VTGADAKHDPPTRVMVVDDHPMWRDSVSRDLSEAGFQVVAATGEGLQAMRIAAPVRPDVVVLDLQLPDVSGVDVTRGVLAAYPGAKVLILSASGEHRDVLDAVKAGAAGYILKSASRAEFLDAVRGTAAGATGWTWSGTRSSTAWTPGCGEVSYSLTLTGRPAGAGPGQIA
jgi:DNA-binding NarL/FixJ family response regulator